MGAYIFCTNQGLRLHTEPYYRNHRFDLRGYKGLNLMIDKIQYCLDEKVGIEYVDFKGHVYYASIGQIKEWHNWFKENRERYYLQEYYDIDGEMLIGRALFSGQSLSNPIPETAEEIL